jgi:hypothetical protein
VLNAAAGRTTAANKATNGPGRPTMRLADPRKTIPETIVPIAVNTAMLISEFLNLATARNNPKTTKDVITLSIIFGNKPPGKVVVRPEIIPVTNPNRSTLFLSGNKKIPKNIIVNIISGFIPRKNPGITVCNTAPIPTNNDKATRFFVFNSHLSSTFLN